MAQTLIRSITSLLTLGGTSVFNADGSLDGTTKATYLYADLGADIYSQGAWQFRIKSGQPGAAGAQVQLVIADDTGFNTNKVVVANVSLPSVTGEQHYVQLWDRGPGNGRYMRMEANGIALAGVGITFDWEVVGIP